MGRKNSKVRRANDRGRLSRRGRDESRQVRVPNSRIDIEKMVLPEGKCFFQSRRGKAIFRTEEKAATALRQAQAQRRFSGSGHVEKRYYRCPEGGCGGYHLTSREAFDENAWKRGKQ